MFHKYRTSSFPLHLTTVSSLLRFVLISLLFCLEAVESDHSDCVEVICPLEEKGTALRLFDKAELEEGEKCERCEQCTRNGYSVCLLPVPLNLPSVAASPPILSPCECAHSGPNVRIVNEKVPSKALDKTSSPFECRLPTSKGRPLKSALRPNSDEGISKLCFSSAIRKLPKPKAKYNLTQNGKMPDLLVSIEQFWLSDYWKALKPTELLLFYLFPVTKKENCEGQFIVPNINQLLWINAGKSKEQVAKQKSGIWLCRASLLIDMSESAEEYPTEEETSPEVLFEHDVFVGAEKVQLYYEITVQRENQLKMSTGKVKFETRKTKLESEPLDFELGEEHFQRYLQQMNRSGSGTENGQRSIGKGAGHRPSRIDRVDIEQRKAATQTQRTESAQKVAEDQAQTKLIPEASTAVPAPPGSVPTVHSSPTGHRSNSEDPSAPIILPSPSSPRDGGESDDRTEKRLGPNGSEDEAEEEDWQLLRNVLLISLLTIAVLFSVALCYKKRLCCFGRSAQAERNAKTRNINGKQYRETGQRLK
ncbi:hypothetical protein niasHS_012032 [Heterodera schachtii]|uniref:Uncharacterized protein n=1 Tax=Heterodera schachtii TaxID=97005 RepID=A0ABD2ILL5_HETSC